MSIDNKPDEVSVVYTNGDGRAWSAMLRAYGDNQLLGLTAEEAGELAGLDGAAPTSKRNSRPNPDGLHRTAGHHRRYEHHPHKPVRPTR